ncbi:glycoside hydrolase family 97 catalytic domain-containing protein [Bacteroides rodentium]|uniref:glycoside hydrolase family 97 catalytic domain-containing protein n=1 Tax=Bacteroides rodentium TaxID=691816 RepID=UPI0010082B8C|nr:glycoside hydrolase family 97 catalytic domain-containing protein [Bacteroides rodentium]
MNKMDRLRVGLLLLFLCPFLVEAKEVKLASPNKGLHAEVSIDEHVSIRVLQNNDILFAVRNIYLKTDQGYLPGKFPKIRSVKKKTVDRMVVPEIKEKRSVIAEHYNEVSLLFADKTKLEIRLYNEGMAYRMSTNRKGELTIGDEAADFVFDPSSTVFFQQDSNMNSDYEAPYVEQKIQDIEQGVAGNYPALVKNPSGTNILLLESDLQDYPCLWLEKGSQNLNAHFWNYPKTYNVNGDSKGRRRIISCEDYIAKTSGKRTFPWRVFAVAQEDKDLMNNQLVYLLAPECQIEDPSWIKPGWVTFDWWARRGLYNVDFKAGINTATAKYMIDFAADFGIRYFLFDDGWTYKEDLTKTIAGLDMKEVVDYATSKGVDVMLWVTYDLFDNQMDAALAQFSEWGIKGLKIDFINRSDQEASNFYWKAAKKAAEYKMVLDFHGAYRPDGLRRAYPNVLTREALVEFEQNGGTYKDNPDNRLMLPFIRNVAGPMDYIPGTMNNATKRSFRFNHDTPMGQGTSSFHGNGCHFREPYANAA